MATRGSPTAALFATLCRRWWSLTTLLVGFLCCHLALEGSAATVKHTLEVGYFRVDPDGTGPTWVQGIGDSVPGPEIRVRQGDRLQVTVVNRCATEKVSIHWHGFEMRAAQEYDGAMQITQCGIEPGHYLIYDFVVDETPGTYVYHEHAHLEHVAARGLFGPLVVEQPAGAAGLWEYNGEATLLFSDYWRKSPHELERIKQAMLVRPVSTSAQGNNVGLLPFHNLLINGKGAFNVFGTKEPEGNWLERLATLTPRAGETWRLRLINSGSLFAMRFRIDGHRLRVIQADAADVEPYDCDAVTMASGERFDVLVMFDQAPGRYWMRLETLEGMFGMHHGQLGVLTYGNDIGQRPDYDEWLLLRRRSIQDSPELVTLGCVDQATFSTTCRPITDLVRHPRLFTHSSVGTTEDRTHDFELSYRGFGGANPSHFTRLLDLAQSPNVYGENQFDGEYVQFMLPKVPYSHGYGEEDAQHPNALTMHVEEGELVRVIIQAQDRTAHPWHLHGHKFAVLAQGFPNYEKDCDILFCRSRYNDWISRDGLPEMLDPTRAPLKDTVHVPAGGWAIIQFRADNPGWWFFHCHMAIHVNDGMAVIVAEAAQQIPSRLTNTTYLGERGFPSCEEEVKLLRREGPGLSCSCWQDPEMKIDDGPRYTYRCSQAYLCGEDMINPLDPEPARLGARNRASGRAWRFGMLGLEILLVLLLFALKHWLNRSSLRRADFSSIQTVSTERRDADISQSYAAAREDLRLVIATSLYRFDIHIMAYTWTRSGKSPAVLMDLPRGSLTVVLGEPAHTTPWMNFIAGRKLPLGSKSAVLGNVFMDGRHIGKWDRLALRRACGWVPKEATERSGVTVLEAFDLYSVLGHTPDLHSTTESRLRYRDHVIGFFDLQKHLGKRLQSLSQSVLNRVLVARQLLLPCGVIVLQEPLVGLRPLDAARFVRLLKAATQEFNVSIIFATCSLIAEAAQQPSHVLLVAERSQPVFAEPASLECFCEYIGEPVVVGTPVVEWLSRLIFQGALACKIDKDGTWTGSNASKNDASMQSAKSNPSSGSRPLFLQHLTSPSHSKVDAASSSMGTSPRFWFRSMKSVLQDATPLPGWRFGRHEAVSRVHVPIWKQVWVLFQYELRRGLADSITVFKCVETFGIGVATGLVWFQKGSQDTQTSLGESIGLLFFSTALWSIPPIFQALHATQQLISDSSHEYHVGLYTPFALVTATFFSWTLLVVVWAPIWQIIVYALADLGCSWQTMVKMHVVLMLNVVSMRTVGLCLALVVPIGSVNVVIANLFGQLCMLTNGFYTKLPSWFTWITVVSIPRYTLRALMKLEFTWRDTFTVNPMQGVAGFGYPTRYIPAELTQIFQTMVEREMDVMRSPTEPSVVQEILVLLGITICFQGLFCMGILVKFRGLQRSREKVPSEAFNLVECPWEFQPQGGDSREDLFGDSVSVTERGFAHRLREPSEVAWSEVDDYLMQSTNTTPLATTMSRLSLEHVDEKSFSEEVIMI